MQRLTIVLSVQILSVTIFCASVSAQTRIDESDYYESVLVPWSTAKSFIIYHIDSDRIVAALNPEYTGPVASLTKMMTCLLADELLDYDTGYKLAADEAKLLQMTPPTAKKQNASSGSTDIDAMFREPVPGDAYTPPPVLTLSQLIDLALVPSNNTVCKVMARLIDGSEDRFAERMTNRATELGLKNTLYCNATGLPSKSQQYSTANDQLKLALEVLKRPNLMATVAKLNIYHKEQYDSTLLYLKKRYPIYGIKTGWTNAAGRCLVLLLDHPKYGKFIVIQMKSKGIAQGFVDAEVILSRFGLIEPTADSLLNEARRQEKERAANTQIPANSEVKN